MIISNLETYLANFSFASLFMTLLFYWIGSIFFNSNILSSVGNLGMLISNLLLAGLLLIRWILSHHFPLSNLYESLMFLSWTLTLLHLIFEKTTSSSILGFFNAFSFVFILLAAASPILLFCFGFFAIYLGIVIGVLLFKNNF